MKIEIGNGAKTENPDVQNSNTNGNPAILVVVTETETERITKTTKTSSSDPINQCQNQYLLLHKLKSSSWLNKAGAALVIAGGIGFLVYLMCIYAAIIVASVPGTHEKPDLNSTSTSMSTSMAGVNISLTTTETIYTKV